MVSLRILQGHGPVRDGPRTGSRPARYAKLSSNCAHLQQPGLRDAWQIRMGGPDRRKRARESADRSHARRHRRDADVLFQPPCPAARVVTWPPGRTGSEDTVRTRIGHACQAERPYRFEHSRMAHGCLPIRRMGFGSAPVRAKPGRIVCRDAQVIGGRELTGRESHHPSLRRRRCSWRRVSMRLARSSSSRRHAARLSRTTRGSSSRGVLVVSPPVLTYLRTRSPSGGTKSPFCAGR